MAKAVARAAELADRAARQAAENATAAAECRIPATVPAKVPTAERLISRWGQNRLPHSFATLARREPGLEGDGSALGRSKLSVTELYAEKDVALARRVASAIG